MSEITCIRLLHETSKSDGLIANVRAINEGKSTDALFVVDSNSFTQVPNAPFSYAIQDGVRKLFKQMPPFENSERTARLGLKTCDDFRFVRCWWEIKSSFNKQDGNGWFPFAKGGAYSPYYADLFLLVNWNKNGSEIKNSVIKRYPYLNGNPGFVVKNTDYYFRAGLTWSEATTKEFGCRPLPADSIFGEVGPGVFQEDKSFLLATQVILNSPQLRSLMAISLGLADAGRRHYTAGTIQRLPMANFNEGQLKVLNEIGYQAWETQRSRDFINEISHFFISPMGEGNHDSLKIIQKALDANQAKRTKDLITLERRATELVAEVYGFTPPEPPSSSTPPEEIDPEDKRSGQSIDIAVISYLVGLVFKRWKVLGNYELALKNYSNDPFAPLPLFSAGYDISTDNTDQYAFFEGDKLYHLLRNELLVLFGQDKAANIEAELCSMLSVTSINDYLVRPGAFFADHVSFYSESRRQAPIYLPISTKSGAFTIWIYYPRLNHNTLPRLITEIVDPKLRKANEELAGMAGLAKVGARKAELELMIQELMEMRDDFQKLIDGGYRPNKNDGVLITAAPFARFFRYAKFRKDLEACWKELSRGDYDWAHLAMSMWPERVLEACKTDRSIAIAHGRDELCPPDKPREKRSRSSEA